MTNALLLRRRGMMGQQGGGAVVTEQFHPTSFDNDNSHYSGTYPSSSQSVGFNFATNTSNVRFNPVPGATELYVTYVFDLSSIPNDAVIVSVGCQVKSYMSSQFSPRTATLLSGSTQKGESVALGSSSSAALKTFADAGTWTRAELDDCKIKVYGHKPDTSNSRYLYFYGATLTITYRQ